MNNSLKRIVIVGGGTAGWMCAAAFSKFFNKKIKITLIESEELGTVGVGEATIPHLRFFNSTLGIDEADFIRATKATLKLGIELIGWGSKYQSYMHPFADFGTPLGGHDFFSVFKKQMQNEKCNSLDLFNYSYPIALAKNNRFALPSNQLKPITSDYSYAYHIDASLYASMLRRYSETRGVQRIEGKITSVIQNAQTGDIESVSLDNNESVTGDMFFDCSGFKSLLLGKTLNAPFSSWKKWLPCDTAIAQPRSHRNPENIKPYTKATAHSAGWQWKIPLIHRTGNGFVFASDFMTEENASKAFDAQLTGNPLANQRLIKFEAGYRKNSWQKNCVAVGLSSGFLEPLESTSIYLIQASIMNAIDMLSMEYRSSAPRTEYNRRMNTEYERIRDFLILHYNITDRIDSDFWQYCKNMSIPESAQTRLNMFKNSSYMQSYDNGLFLTPSWITLFIGQGLTPNSSKLVENNIEAKDAAKHLLDVKNIINELVSQTTSHNDFLKTVHGNSMSLQPDPDWPPTAMSLYGVFQ